MPSKKNKNSSSTTGHNVSTAEKSQNNKPANRFDLLGEIDDMIEDTNTTQSHSSDGTESPNDVNDVNDNGITTYNNKYNNKDNNNDNDGFQSVNYNRGKSKKVQNLSDLDTIQNSQSNNLPIKPTLDQ